MLLALAALDLNGKCGYFCSDPVTIAHPLCKPSVRDVYGVYNLTAFTTNIPLESWLTMTVARTSGPPSKRQITRGRALAYHRDPTAGADEGQNGRKTQNDP